MKKSFVLYTDYREHISLLNTEEKAELLEAIFTFADTGLTFQMLPKSEMAFSFIKAQMTRDRDKWSGELEKRREAGRLGGLAKQAHARSAKQVLANQGDNVNVTVTVTDNVIKEKNTMSDKSDVMQLGKVKDSRNYKQEAIEVLTWLNHVTGKSYRLVDSNINLVIGRLKSGATVEQCRAVIAIKNRAWKDDPKMMQYLRPETLFGKTKFESYIAEVGNVQKA